MPPNLARHLYKVASLKPPRPTQFLDRHTALGLPEKSDDLLVGESALLHVRSFSENGLY